MEIVVGSLLVWLAHAVSAALLTAPTVFLGRRRVAWQIWELLAFAVPFGVWWKMMASDAVPGKSMSNFAIELSLITVAIPTAALVRLLLGRTLAAPVTAAGLLLSLTMFAASVYWSIPGLPE